MNTKERLKSYCKSIGITVKEFENSINVSNGYVNSISKGIGEDKLSIIIEKYPNLSIEWLLTGIGTMTKESTPTIEPPFEQLRAEIKELVKMMGDLTKRQNEMFEKLSSIEKDSGEKCV